MLLVLLRIIIFLPYYFLKDIILYIWRLFGKGNITGQHVLITGAAEGIGAEFALQFAKMGNTIHCLDINAERLDETVKDLIGQGYNAFAYKCDLTKINEIQHVADSLEHKNVEITVLVNNAGVAFATHFLEMSPTQLSYSINVNLIASMWTTRLFLPKMKFLNQGHIINVASLAGFFPILRNSTDYCSAKAGLIHLGRQLEFELSYTDIKVTTVCPSFVNTNMIRGITEDLKSRGTLVEPADLVAAAIDGAAKGLSMVIYPHYFNVICCIFNLIPSSMKRKMYQKLVLQDLHHHDTFVGQNMRERIK